jgi:DNA-binding response OmpR family regulator
MQSIEKPTILVADDEPAIRKMITDILHKEGYNVISAADGERALAKARNHPGSIDLLITDVIMPTVDGFDLREKLLRERMHVPVLVVSGQLDPKMVGEDFAILRKPFLPAELVAKVQEVLKSP